MTRTPQRRRIGLILLALCLAACSRGTQEPSAQDSPVEALADEYLAAMLERYPEVATPYALPGARHDRLYDNSLDALAAWQDREDEWLAALRAIDAPAGIGSRDWVTYGVLLHELESAAATRVCRNELWQASTTTAWYNGLPFVFETQPIDDAELRAQALTRLGSVDDYIDTEIANLRMGLELGYSAPRVTVEAVPAQVRALDDADSIFLDPAIRSSRPPCSPSTRTRSYPPYIDSPTSSRTAISARRARRLH
jgi:uncharacterized protein (DUF885 family)